MAHVYVEDCDPASLFWFLKMTEAGPFEGEMKASCKSQFWGDETAVWLSHEDKYGNTTGQTAGASCTDCGR